MGLESIASFALPVLGDLAGGFIGAKSASDVNRKYMEWQERMSNTAYQRAVRDMRAAGLNPAMMFGRGGPEGTGPLPSPVVPGEIAGKGISHAARAAAMEIPRLRAEIADMQWSAKEKQAKTDVAAAEVRNLDARTGLVSAEQFKAQMDALAAWSRSRLDDVNRGRGQLRLEGTDASLQRLVDFLERAVLGPDQTYPDDREIEAAQSGLSDLPSIGADKLAGLGHILARLLPRGAKFPGSAKMRADQLAAYRRALGAIRNRRRRRVSAVNPNVK